jgi:hypothetical protein
VQTKSEDSKKAWWLVITFAGLALGAVHDAGCATVTAPAMAVTPQTLRAAAQPGQSASTGKLPEGPSVAHGMGKEAVRTVWGDPDEVRKIRTCFGWQEEWVYRGDSKRFGADERILLFDEGEVLVEIK